MAESWKVDLEENTEMCIFLSKKGSVTLSCKDEFIAKVLALDLSLMEYTCLINACIST
jgi:hypothetical protein